MDPNAQGVQYFLDTRQGRDTSNEGVEGHTLSICFLGPFSFRVLVGRIQWYFPPPCGTVGGESSADPGYESRLSSKRRAREAIVDWKV